MNLKKWFFLFWSSMAVGAIVCVVTGAVMQWADPEFGFLGFKAVGFNALMMAMVGLMIGAFSQMGFFAYMTLNYIALSVFGKKYLWNALQGYTTVFAAVGLGYILYEKALNNWFFWVLPLCLLIVSGLVARFKVQQTNKTALVPTMFLMVVVTFIEAWPAIKGDTNVSAIIFMIVPLFACNAYQIMMMHRLLKKETTGSSAIAAKPVV
ncbi:KinB-signaling pathway activation protein [Paenibacillus alkaliterrae]|uniref:KinB-signaling pathway activation protein n=1 Tax=Paenibacillus alkaliterrae TaxID=320909 RepID=UPI001F2160BA|nr:KinB-signaling pathway activation protein [Paenibacillus alkaliterrae]MCF2940278.1 KinB-signaling pathway activation protein [Paenibacillus alkaliterrae]